LKIYLHKQWRNQRFEPGWGRTLLKEAHWPPFEYAIISAPKLTYITSWADPASNF